MQESETQQRPHLRGLVFQLLSSYSAISSLTPTTLKLLIVQIIFTYGLKNFYEISISAAEWNICVQVQLVLNSTLCQEENRRNVWNVDTRLTLVLS